VDRCVHEVIDPVDPRWMPSLVDPVEGARKLIN